MRCTQLRGLTDEALEFINENCRKVPIKFCPHCNEALEIGNYCEVYEDASHTGMFDDGPDLRKYHMEDGTTIKEIIQEIPWSSGPCIFMCLVNEKGTRMFEWPQSEINNA